MVTSMTGYGFAEERLADGWISVEMKSVNHRFLDVLFSLPSALRSLEEEGRKIVKEKVQRGKVDITVTFTGTPSALGIEKRLHIDWHLLRQYVREAERLQACDAFDEKLSLNDFLLNEQIVSIQEETGEAPSVRQAFLNTMRTACSELMEMRNKEGQELSWDLVRYMQHISEGLSTLEARLPEVQSRYRQKLEQKIKAMIDTVDEDRLLTEVAIFADKSDVSEELARMNAHIKQFRDTLKEAGTIGRKLDFITQEMNREVNTIGSKGNDQCLSKIVVEMKSILEKVKEQVQNIE
ncbi:YicC/YloC family endoribonuclease [Salicibibacter kimchii]|uniref:YicC family protein n=1 Tax=Salicibibacter kimchii TaxID=2099786 RepID=A0A345BWW4_9BACI|nr:YicC/YloC family endoribonuclease [Salicibibacter kimchii]AXF55445.1 YicC family protein [Salicibibacter kimchii]